MDGWTQNQQLRQFPAEVSLFQSLEVMFLNYNYNSGENGDFPHFRRL